MNWEKYNSFPDYAFKDVNVKFHLSSSSISSPLGYAEMGKVYKDPSTGKLIIVEG